MSRPRSAPAAADPEAGARTPPVRKIFDTERAGYSLARLRVVLRVVLRGAPADARLADPERPEAAATTTRTVGTGGTSGEILDTVVIGGGQAGLAMARHLARQHLRFVVLDAGRELHQRGVTDVPGLYFAGLSWQHARGSALLGFVSGDAAHLAGRVAARHRMGDAGRLDLQAGLARSIPRVSGPLCA